MIPKGKAAGILVIFVAIGLITATGAFTTVSAQRTATVKTAGDGSALLALNPVDTNYATISGGTLEIAVDGSLGNNNDMGSGVNLNALTQIDDVFSITNQGTQPVDVWITVSTNGSAPQGIVSFYNQTHGNDRTAIESQGAAQTLDVGDSMNVSMSIDTRGQNLDQGQQLIDSITVHANATA